MAFEKVFSAMAVDVEGVPKLRVPGAECLQFLLSTNGVICEVAEVVTIYQRMAWEATQFLSMGRHSGKPRPVAH